MVVCVECGFPVNDIYRDFGNSNIRLTRCSHCGETADKYIEYDSLILLLELILHKQQAYRHVLFNRLKYIDRGLDKEIIKFSIAIIFFDAYTKWFLIRSEYEGRDSGGAETKTRNVLHTAKKAKSDEWQHGDHWDDESVTGRLSEMQEDFDGQLGGGISERTSPGICLYHKPCFPTNSCLNPMCSAVPSHASPHPSRIEDEMVLSEVFIPPHERHCQILFSAAAEFVVYLCTLCFLSMLYVHFTHRRRKRYRKQTAKAQKHTRGETMARAHHNDISEPQTTNSTPGPLTVQCSTRSPPISRSVNLSFCSSYIQSLPDSATISASPDSGSPSIIPLNSESACFVSGQRPPQSPPLFHPPSPRPPPAMRTIMDGCGGGSETSLALVKYNYLIASLVLSMYGKLGTVLMVIWDMNMTLRRPIFFFIVSSNILAVKVFLNLSSVWPATGIVSGGLLVRWLLQIVFRRMFFY
eukprot:GHVQ01032950.1.p1 GENE.GHVQ01032950.1~~GHVQ01032950.1.p1  ORF type:complete len:467 (+),score=46.53 GHVQ01032950.1:194-1594(+)